MNAAVSIATGLQINPKSPQVISGMLLWMRADDLAGGDGDAIAAWVSKEGNAYSFAQADPTKRPVLKTGANGINGHNVVRFDGSNDILTLPSAPLTGSAGTVFAVYRLSASPTTYQHILASCDEATTTKYMRFEVYYVNSGQIAVDQTGPNGVRGGDVHLVNQRYCGMWQSDGAAYTLRLNKSSQTKTVAAGADNGNWFSDTPDRDNTTIGGMKRTTESSFLKGDIAEILVYDSTLNSAQISAVETYLESRYGNFYAPSQFLQYYGGTGDNSYNNIYAFQNALAAMVEAGGGTIYIPEGIYRVTGEDLLWYDNVSLIGDGMEKSIVRFVGVRQFMTHRTVSTPLTNCNFTDFQVDGSLQTGWTKGFDFGYNLNHIWNRVKVYQTGASGFTTDHGVDVTYIDCIVDGAGRTQTVETSGCSGFGIGTGKYQVENITLINCTARNCKRYGLFFEMQDAGARAYWSTGMRILGGVFEGNQWGIGDCGVDGMLVDGAIIRNNIAEGIYVGGPSLGEAGVNGIIQNCQIYGNGAAGIRPASGGEGYTLINNNLHDNGA